jgi:hypothetical protein
MVFPREIEEEFELEMDGRAYRVDQVTTANHGSEAKIHVNSQFKVGTLRVAVSNGIEDYAGLTSFPNQFDVKVVKDTDPPEVTGYKNITREHVPSSSIRIFRLKTK